ncbi:MAG TPA: DUF3786 domain-containing protein [Methanomassiliicoccales archaeon]|nr:DUF3786 domain-containing protein [Methanomassiliicoccales archaeon]
MPCDPSHRQAMMLAWDALARVPDERLAEASGGELRGRELALTTLGQWTMVDLADRTVTTPDLLGGSWGLIALHHLKGCLAWKDDAEWTSYDQVAEGRPFAAAFQARGIAPLADRFGGSPGDLVRTVGALGGRPMALGDAAAVLHAFPRLKVAVVVWRGDDEVSGRAILLFERGGARTLPAEDLAEAGIALSQALISKAR